MNAMAILTDVTLCIGCDECVSACKETNNTGKDKKYRWIKNCEDLSAARWTTVVRRPEKHFIRDMCRHCLEPACVSACLVGALTKTKEGPVVYNDDICMGCRYCMMSCPYGVPKYSWKDSIHYVRKCVMCHDKITSGELSEPACTNACPTDATIYGDRDELLKIAHQRIADNPKKYIDKVWGEHDVGGTSVLYLSDIDLDFMAWNSRPGNEALPAKTWGALSKVPSVFVGMGVAMGGLYWLFERREQVAKELAERKEQNKVETK